MPGYAGLAHKTLRSLSTTSARHTTGGRALRRVLPKQGGGGKRQEQAVHCRNRVSGVALTRARPISRGSITERSRHRPTVALPALNRLKSGVISHRLAGFILKFQKYWANRVRPSFVFASARMDDSRIVRPLFDLLEFAGSMLQPSVLRARPLDIGYQQSNTANPSVCAKSGRFDSSYGCPSMECRIR